MLDPTEFGKAMAAIVREAQAPLLKRIEQLEARTAEPGPPGKDAQVDEAHLKFLVDTAVLSAMLAAPAQKGDQGDRGLQGDKGDAGRDADPIDVKDIVAELLSGKEIATLVELHVAEAVQKHFEANPVINGKDGRDGIDGKPGVQGERGDKGKTGSDGVGQAGAMIDRDGCLVITTTKGEAIKLGTVVGKDGLPGKDGADFSDATIDYDGDRDLIIRSRSGAEIRKRMPLPHDEGYWREGMACEKGAMVTQLGDVWLALRDTKTKPCRENKDDWRLFARKGRDGIDGKAGRDLGPAPPVKLGTANA